MDPAARCELHPSDAQRVGTARGGGGAREVYTGMLGVALAIAALHRQVPWPSLRAAAFAIIVPLVVLSWRQAELWGDTDG